MKKKLLAMLGVMVLTLGTSMSAFAAGSPSANSAAASTETVVTTPSGQNISEASLVTFAAETKMTSDVEGATMTATSTGAAVSLTYFAGEKVGANAKVLTMVDITASKPGKFTLAVDGIVAGQNVTVLHLIDSTHVEVLPATAGNGTVTFSMTSYSPVAVVTNATSPRTGANTVVIVLVAIAAASAAVFCTKRYAK